jgi:hypothetical protein
VIINIIRSKSLSIQHLQSQQFAGIMLVLTCLFFLLLNGQVQDLTWLLYKARSVNPTVTGRFIDTLNNYAPEAQIKRILRQNLLVYSLLSDD